MRGKVAKKLKRFAAIHPDPAAHSFLLAAWKEAPHDQRGELTQHLKERGIRV